VSTSASVDTLNNSMNSADGVSQPNDRVNVLGVGISPVNLDTAEDLIFNAIDSGQQGYVGVTGVHGVSEAQNDSKFKDILNNTFINTPDGMPMVWYARLYGFEKVSRVYGPDLMLNICARSVDRKVKHFFYGGREGVAETLEEKLEKKFPGLEVVGTYTPPFRPLTEEEEIEVRNLINNSGAHCVWVGLSTPKQEKFMSGFLNRFGANESGDSSLKGPKVFFGVGAAFDFHAGLIPQAPNWMQQSGLEWLYRLYKEPKRLWKRYLKNNPLFLFRALLQIFGVKKYTL
jgi:N-acetylglucosaminyldiphosphoundecaprenol N-acetyl-beta-D-mannosaminyltransferase